MSGRSRSEDGMRGLASIGLCVLSTGSPPQLSPHEGYAEYQVALSECWQARSAIP